MREHHFVELALHHNGAKAFINMALIEGFFADTDGGTILASAVPTDAQGNSNNWKVKESYAEVAALIGKDAS